ncbi:hypothetical protein JNK13_04055 [bacterium]|nr:hypothetical protein [bacterium]
MDRMIYIQSVKNNNLKRIFSRQRGNAALAALVGIVSVLAYFKYGYSLISQDLHPIVATATVAIIFVFFAGLTGYFVHREKLGLATSDSTRSEVSHRVSQLEALVDSVYQKIRSQEEVALHRTYIVSRRALENISKLKRILRALSIRTSEVRDLLDNGSAVALIDAHELLNRKLFLEESALDAVIDSDPVPPLSPLEWDLVVQKLSYEVDEELERLERMVA